MITKLIRPAKPLVQDFLRIGDNEFGGNGFEFGGFVRRPARPDGRRSGRKGLGGFC
jgi:hypothetical protein